MFNTVTLEEADLDRKGTDKLADGNESTKIAYTYKHYYRHAYCIARRALTSGMGGHANIRPIGFSKRYKDLPKKSTVYTLRNIFTVGCCGIYPVTKAPV